MVSVEDWNEFLFKVGQDFYDFVHGIDENGNEYTKIDYPYTIQYKGVYLSNFYNYIGSGSAVIPSTCYFKLQSDDVLVCSFDELCVNSNLTNCNPGIIDRISSDYSYQIFCPNSFTGADYPFYIVNSARYGKYNASHDMVTNLFRFSLNYKEMHPNGSDVIRDHSTDVSGQYIGVNYSCVDLYQNYNGYDYYFDTHGSMVQSLDNINNVFQHHSPNPLNNYPILINSNYIQYTTYYDQITNNYNTINNTTINNYTYTTNDNTTTINVGYSTDGGLLDIQPNGQISFDDLFDMFNTILAPIVGVGLDLPDWNDYLPPVVTGDINVNIDLPDITGEYAAETITPIESDVYNIMPVDSMPQLPSLTGIDNGESAVALGSSFTFLDGCGLLMPFVTIAIIRLLISKFRGDS